MENRKSLFDLIAKTPEESSLLQLKSKLRALLYMALKREYLNKTQAAIRLGCGPAKIKQIHDCNIHALSLGF